MLSTKDLVFKERLTKKLIERYVRPYEIEKVISKNAVKLKLLDLMRIHLVVNVSKVVGYRKLVKKQRVEELKPVEVEGVEKWEVEKILNKRKIQEIKKYLVYQKEFIVKNESGGLNLFSFPFLFLELRVRVRVTIGYSYKLQDIIEESRKFQKK